MRFESITQSEVRSQVSHNATGSAGRGPNRAIQFPLYSADISTADQTVISTISETAKWTWAEFRWSLHLASETEAGRPLPVRGSLGPQPPGPFLPFIESGDVDVILVALNFVDRYTYNFEETVLPLARKHNVGVVAMKAFGGPDNKSGSWGTRKATPMVGVDRVESAIRYALSLPGVATANLGVHTVEQLRQNLEIVRRYQPLTIEEQEQLTSAGRELAKEWGPHFGPIA